MILSISLPELGMGIKKARMAAWNAQEGDEIAFGDVVCVVKVREWEMAGRTKDASRLSRLSRKGRQEASGPARMRCPSCGDIEALEAQLACRDCLHFQVMASETGTLRSIEVPDGETVTLGGVLGLVEVGGETDQAGADHPKMRIVVDMVDRAEGDL